MNQLGGLLQQYAGGDQPAGDVHSDFDQLAQSAPRSAVADGLAAAFRSDQTPPFGQMVSQLFSRSDGQQQAGLLNTLISAAGPTIVSQVLSRAGGGASGLAGLLGGGQAQVTPEQARQVPPDAVREIAAHAERQDPSVVDQIGGFYAQHPTLVKSLGAAALTAVLAKIAQGGYGSQRASG